MIKSFLKKCKFSLLVLFLFPILINAYELPFSIVSYNNGVLTTPDKITIDVVLVPDGTLLQYVYDNPSSSMWYTTETRSDNNQHAIIFYTVLFFNGDVTKSVETISLVGDKEGYKLATSEHVAITDSLESSNNILYSLRAYLGAYQKGYQVFMPDDGSEVKDSVMIYDSLKVLKAVIKFYHSNTNAVLDTAFYEVK